MAVNKEVIQFSAKGMKKLQGDIKSLDRQIRKLDKAYRDSSKSGKSNTKNMGAMIAKLGIGYIAFRALTSAISGVIRVGKEFEKNMSNVAAISGATGAELLALEKNARDLGATTVFTATQVAGLQTEFAKLGFTSKEIRGVTKDTLALAAASGADLATSAAVAGQTLRAFGLSVGETSRVTDTMALSFSRSALDMEKFTNSMQYVAPVAKAVGFSVEGTTALLGGLANAGISGSMAGTALRTVFLKLADSNSELSKKLGGSVTSADELLPALKKLSDSGIDLTEILGLVDKRAVSAFKILLDGSDDVAKLKDELDNSAGAAQRMADIQLDNLEGSMTLLKSATEGLGIAFFDTFDEALKDAVDGITSMISGLTQMLAIPMSEKIREEQREFNTLFNILTDVNSVEDTRKRAIDELQKKYPDYIKNIDLESGSYDDLKLAQDGVNESFRESIRLRAAEEVLLKYRKEVEENKLELYEATKALNAWNESGKKDRVGEYGLGQSFMLNKALMMSQENLKESIAVYSEYELALLGADSALSGLVKKIGDPPPVLPGVPPVLDGDGKDEPADKTKEQLNKELALVQSHLRQKDQYLLDDFEVQKASLITFRDDMMKIKDDYNVQEEDITSLFNERMTRLEAVSAQKRLNIQSSLVKSIAGFAGQFAGGLKASARLQQVAALIDAYSAANTALATVKPYPLNIAAAATIYAQAFGNVMAISKSIGEFKSAAQGANEIVTSPTLFLTGEAGAEHVNITPLGGSGSASSATTANIINVNISAPLVDETVIESIIPAIERAKRLNLA